MSELLNRALLQIHWMMVHISGCVAQSVPTDFFIDMGRPRDKRNLATEGFDVVLSSSEGYMEGKPGSVKVRWKAGECQGKRGSRGVSR